MIGKERRQTIAGILPVKKESNVCALLRKTKLYSKNLENLDCSFKKFHLIENGNGIQIQLFTI